MEFSFLATNSKFVFVSLKRNLIKSTDSPRRQHDDDYYYYSQEVNSFFFYFFFRGKLPADLSLSQLK